MQYSWLTYSAVSYLSRRSGDSIRLRINHVYIYILSSIKLQDSAMKLCPLQRLILSLCSCSKYRLIHLRLCNLQISSIPFTLHQSLSEYSPKNPDLQRWRLANQILKICTARDTYPRVTSNCVITYAQSGHFAHLTVAECVTAIVHSGKPGMLRISPKITFIWSRAALTYSTLKGHSSSSVH